MSRRTSAGFSKWRAKPGGTYASLIGGVKDLAGQTFQISESCDRYDRTLSDENAEISEWLVTLASHRRTWGFGLCFCICVM
ncbi:MAG: hypothetical protein COB16_12545 [Rhodobacteraceae bacterium]|nr:MAG: hypothetical protein COB16_12545 [Paracoccaceae bacterium]